MPKETFLFSKQTGRLDKFLTDSLSGRVSRSQAQQLIAAGKVFLDGKPVLDKSLKLTAGDSVAVDYQPPKLIPRNDVVFAVVYEDDDLLVVEKPAGLVVHPTPSQSKPSLAAGILAKYRGLKGLGDEFRPGIVHRLDADTSGLLVVAKTARSYKFLQEAFRKREVEKEYLALVHGLVKNKHGLLEQAIGRKAGQKKFSAGFGRDARTEYWVEGYYDGVDPAPNVLRRAERSGVPHQTSGASLGAGVDKYTLVRVRLHTGRTHQIRVHFSSIGHPLAGDKLYGGKFRAVDGQLFPRQFLHACRLKFCLYDTEPKEFISPLPADLKQVLKSLKSIT